MIIVKIVRKSSGDNEKKEKIKFNKEILFTTSCRLEILIIKKDIRTIPNTSIKSRMKSIADTKRSLYLSSFLRTVFNDLNKLFIIAR